MKQLGVGVVGLGEMGRAHSEVYAQLPNVRLAAVYDVDQERTGAVARTADARACSSLAALLALPDVAAVSICTPDHLHFAAASGALRAGKHVLVEKPLTTNLSEGAELVRLAERSGLTFMVGHTLRFDPRYYLAREEIAAGGLGDIVHMYARRNNLQTNARRIGGRTSVAMFLGVHDLDVMMWLAESRVESVYAVSAAKLLADLEVADTIMATLRFGSGAIGALEVSWGLPDSFVSALDARLEVLGTKGTLSINIHDQGLRVFKGGRMSYPDISYETHLNGRFVGILREEIAEFVRAITEDRPSPVPAQDGYRAVQVALAVEESARTGSVVMLPSS